MIRKLSLPALKIHPGGVATILLLALGITPLLAQIPVKDTQVLIPMESSWRYHDGNLDLGTTWMEPAYNDSSWMLGPALLGYDTRQRPDRWPEPGLQTELQPRLITYYFRHSFDYDGPLESQQLVIEQIIDDAAVYYLNGVEIARSQYMPEGSVGFNTESTGTTDPWAEHENLYVNNPPLQQGQNVLAVSVHNKGPTSSDICFGAEVSIIPMTRVPPALYLTWQQDPTTTMTIQWHTEGDTGPARVEYRPLDGSGPAAIVEANSHPMVYSHRIIHTAEITGLSPETEYRFHLKNVQPAISSPDYIFRTMPETAARPIRIAIGGDIMHHRAWMEEMNREALRFDPDFIVWGGDLAYSDGKEENLEREYIFFEVMTETLVTDSGRVIPVLAGIGNHEIVDHWYWGANRGRDSYEDSDAYREAIAPYYYNLFAFPGHPGYAVLDFGDYLSLVFLDTDHSGPVEGTQTEWLAQTLAARENTQHIIPVYHVPAYPSFRGIYGATSTRIREHWLPLFEQHGVKLAFEHHDHTYKRTVPILNEQPDEDGIIFIGDGAWGVRLRPVRNPAETWYLEKAISVRHLIILTIQDDIQDVKVISREGKLIDHVTQRIH